MRIAIDFDGTIVEHAFPKIGKEIPDSFDILKKLQAEGFILILWTSRYGKLLDEAVDFCRSRGLGFYAVNRNHPDESLNPVDASRKILADIYIDDRNLGGLQAWPEMYHKLILLNGKKADEQNNTENHG